MPSLVNKWLAQPVCRSLLLLLHLLLTHRLTTCLPRRRSDTMDTLRHGCCLLGIQPPLTTSLLWRLVKAAVLVGHA